MKRTLLIITALLLSCAALRAQDTTRTAPVDSTLLGRDILSVLGSGAQVEQSSTIRQALQQYTLSNAEKPISGYRIRVFYDNGPQARVKSENIEQTLQKQFPEVLVYRSFESPNYKVSIGDFRSKDEALRIFNTIKGPYPTAFIIKESINYPRYGHHLSGTSAETAAEAVTASDSDHQADRDAGAGPGTART